MLTYVVDVFFRYSLLLGTIIQKPDNHLEADMAMTIIQALE
jgi:hypothetical protein